MSEVPSGREEAFGEIGTIGMIFFFFFFLNANSLLEGKCKDLLVWLMAGRAGSVSHTERQRRPMSNSDCLFNKEIPAPELETRCHSSK